MPRNSTSQNLALNPGEQCVYMMEKDPNYWLAMTRGVIKSVLVKCVWCSALLKKSMQFWKNKKCK